MAQNGLRGSEIVDLMKVTKLNAGYPSPIYRSALGEASVEGKKYYVVYEYEGEN